MRPPPAPGERSLTVFLAIVNVVFLPICAYAYMFTGDSPGGGGAQALLKTFVVVALGGLVAAVVFRDRRQIRLAALAAGPLVLFLMIVYAAAA